MKKLGLIGVLAIVAVIVIAVVVAGNMGETSHAYARGTVVLDDSLKVEAKGIRTLFVIAAGPDRPMPLGALKKTLDADPQGVVYEFTLTKESMMMMPGGQGGMPQEFKLKARLDRGGMAGPDKPGDLTGEVYPVHLGQEGVEIRINKLIP